MSYSTLYSIVRTGGEDGLVAVKEATKQLIEDAPSATAYVVGVLPKGISVCHGQPNEAIPKGAIVYRDGSKPWTWNDVAVEFPAIADVVVPHEWAGEPTARDLTTIKFLRYPKPTAEGILAVSPEK